MASSESIEPRTAAEASPQKRESGCAMKAK